MKLTYDDLAAMEDGLIRDKDDPLIFYLNEDCKDHSEFPRLNICRIGKCRFKKEFNNVNGLKRHLEREHRRTFCEVCLKHRLVFVQEQKTYFQKKINDHIEHGDPGDDQCAQILPHPFCNFCNQYFFNDIGLQEHLFKEHMNCPICGDEYKNWYYQNYKSLETHFDKTHYLCKNKQCLKSLFVAFRTEEELSQHNFLLHQKGGDKKQQEEFNLLGFTTDNSGNVVGGKKRDEEIKFKDDEAIDFSWYFGPNYKVKEIRERRARDHKSKYKKEQGRKKNHHDQDSAHEESKEEKKGKQRPIGDLPSDEDKVDKILKAVR
jgi:hypothetical protein